LRSIFGACSGVSSQCSSMRSSQNGSQPVFASRNATRSLLQRERGPVFPLVQADGARVPLRDATFDVVFNEYRAGLWVDPERWFCDYFAPARLEQLDGSIEFHLPHGEWR
jgi:hypothetical protein